MNEKGDQNEKSAMVVINVVVKLTRFNVKEM